MSKLNIFDQTLKIIARNYADVFLRLAFPDVPLQLVGTEENVELAVPIRPVDFVHRIVHAGQEHLLHVEFQLKHEADFPRRMHCYNGALTEQFGLPVVTLALYLLPRQTPLPGAYEVRFDERIVNRFSYPVLKLWDYVDDIRSGQYRALAPLLVMLVDEPDEAVLREERALILEETDDKKRADLLAVAVAVAGRHFDKAFLWRFFREELEQMREATFIEEWIHEEAQKEAQEMGQGMFEQGREQGLQQGGRQAQRAGILDVLALRFDPPVSLYQRLEAQLQAITDLERLRELLQVAVQTSDVAAFESALSAQRADE